MRRKFAGLLFAMAAVIAVPAYAEEAPQETQAEAPAETAAVEEQTSVSEETTAAESQTAATEADPDILTENYTYMSDTGEHHTYPEQIVQGGETYVLQNTEYQTTPITKELQSVSPDLWKGADYAPQQDWNVDGLHYALTDSKPEEWTQQGRTKTVYANDYYEAGAEIPAEYATQTTDDATGETIDCSIPEAARAEEGKWEEGVLNEQIRLTWNADQQTWVWNYNNEDHTPANQDESPSFDGCEDLFLNSLGLEPQFCKVTDIQWDGEGYQDGDQWYRNAILHGDRIVLVTHVWFQGDVALPDLPMIRYTNFYTSDPVSYLVTAAVTYRKVEEEPETEAQTPAETEPQSSVEYLNADDVQNIVSANGNEMQQTLSGEHRALILLTAVGIGIAAAALILLILRGRQKPRAWLHAESGMKNRKNKGERV